MVDRFSTGDDRKDSTLSFSTSETWMGGRINGITKKLEYVRNLGMDAIWLSPVYASSAYYGYSVTDYFQVDSHLGSKSDLQSLVEKAHSLQMKVILDFVPNHLSCLHPFFVSAQKEKSSKYLDWFIFNSWPDNYECFLDSKGLPKLNLENNEARTYILDAAKYWIRECNIDGYRLDFVTGPPMSFWREFARCCYDLNSDFILLPEIWIAGMPSKYLKTLWFVKDNPLATRELEKIMVSNEDAKF